jgi:hypothetical protein
VALDRALGREVHLASRSPHLDRDPVQRAMRDDDQVLEADVEREAPADRAPDIHHLLDQPRHALHRVTHSIGALLQRRSCSTLAREHRQ